MYHRGRKKMRYLIIGLVLFLSCQTNGLPRSIATTEDTEHYTLTDENFDNNIIDFEEDYNIKFNKKHGRIPWNPNEYFNKESHRYTIIREEDKPSNNYEKENDTKTIGEETTTVDFSVIPLELISTTENTLLSIIESTMEPDLTVIPLTTTKKVPDFKIEQPVTLPPSSTQEPESTTELLESTTTIVEENTTINTLSKRTTKTTEPTTVSDSTTLIEDNEFDKNVNISFLHLLSTTEPTTGGPYDTNTNASDKTGVTENDANITTEDYPDIGFTNFDNTNETEAHRNHTKVSIKSTFNESMEVNLNNTQQNINRSDTSSEFDDTDVPIFTELDTEDQSDIPEDYYDTKDVVPTTAPKNDAISVIFGLAGSVVESVVESVAERVVPKGIFDLFKRMQRQSEALEAEKLRSREENGGLGQFTRGILKSITTGIGKPLSQLMAGVRDIGSLDNDRGFVNSLASGVTSVANVANSVVDVFKDRVQAIYPGTVWCGDGRSATARSSDLGLFFFTDTCCRQHDACKLYIKAGDTKYGLTNTGLFTRSHCSCDAKFRECLQKTNSLVSAQIGLTYFNVLGPQCFRRAHPIVKCVKRTRITGQKCEEYELDFTKPKMWQWFDNETF